ncbi:Transcription termination factor 2 [Portunus trituberculatus]|uniref:Transcription termination factor 2 n=1 Tax=Portunus trituberculatus TaxID=210409 RepID=A0A5B7ESY7_PORTR|nr:Transcription termination factor 2 [Portunus trituberculatus]
MWWGMCRKSPTSAIISALSLAQFDIVITTYQIVAREGFKFCEDKQLEKGKKDDVPKVRAKNQGTLFQVGWNRIILDEAHIIRNHRSKTSQAVCMLRGGRRWGLTGTPIQRDDSVLYVAALTEDRNTALFTASSSTLLVRKYCSSLSHHSSHADLSNSSNSPMWPNSGIVQGNRHPRRHCYNLNKDLDLYSLVRFLRAAPFDEYTTFNPFSTARKNSFRGSIQLAPPPASALPHYVCLPHKHIYITCSHCRFLSYSLCMNTENMLIWMFSP